MFLWVSSRVRDKLIQYSILGNVNKIQEIIKNLLFYDTTRIEIKTELYVRRKGFAKKNHFKHFQRVYIQSI